MKYEQKINELDTMLKILEITKNSLNYLENKIKERTSTLKKEDED